MFAASYEAAAIGQPHKAAFEVPAANLPYGWVKRKARLALP